MSAAQEPRIPAAASPTQPCPSWCCRGHLYSQQADSKGGPTNTRTTAAPLPWWKQECPTHTVRSQLSHVKKGACSRSTSGRSIHEHAHSSTDNDGGRAVDPIRQRRYRSPAGDAAQSLAGKHIRVRT